MRMRYVVEVKVVDGIIEEEIDNLYKYIESALETTRDDGIVDTFEVKED